MLPVIPLITAVVSGILLAKHKSPAQILKSFHKWFQDQGISLNTALDPNALASDGTPLIIKSIISPSDIDYSIFHTLLKIGASPNARDSKGTPLLFYVVKYAPHLIPLLEKYQCNFNAMDADGNTALFLLWKNTASMLINAGTLPDARNCKGKSALFYTHDPDFLHILLKAGADPNIQDNEGKTPLFTFPPETSALNIARILVNAGADINITDFSGNIAPITQKFGTELQKSGPDQVELNGRLDDAVNNNNTATVKSLLKAGADPNIRHKYQSNWNMLSLAVENHASQIIRLLGEAGANPNTPSDLSPLTHAIYEKSPDCIQALLDIGAEFTTSDLDHAKYQGILPQVLKYSAIYHIFDPFALDEDFQNEFIKSASDSVNQRDKDGKTSIFYCHHVESIHMLKRCRADFKCTDNTGKTPLFYIDPFSWNAYELTDNFIQCGVDPNIRDNNGKLANVVEHLDELKERAELNAQLNDAVDKNNLHQAEKLLRKGANPNYRHRYQQKWNMIMLAISNKNHTMVRLLAEAGADVNEVICNSTAISDAIYRNSIECIEVLLEFGSNVSEADIRFAKDVPQIQNILKQAVNHRL